MQLVPVNEQQKTDWESNDWSMTQRTLLGIPVLAIKLLKRQSLSYYSTMLHDVIVYMHTIMHPRFKDMLQPTMLWRVKPPNAPVMLQLTFWCII